MKRIIRSIIALSVVLAGQGLAQSGDPLLFDSDTVLELTMPVDFETLCRPSVTPGCDYSPTAFEYVDSAGNQRTIPISIRRRDGWRAQQTNCQVPTLFVKFSQAHTVGTPFDGQSTLALTSHCGKGISKERVQSRRLPDRFESYVSNEYMGYRLYNLISDASLRVRLVEITYAHPVNSRLNFTRKAFFSEHFETFAERLGAKALPEQSFVAEKLDLAAADQVALFQYMIGNTDWSIEHQDNVLLVETPEGTQIPVLYDLDMSGLVNAYYARPGSNVPIKTVKQRYYMGYCNPDTDWDALFGKFNSEHDNMKAILADTPGLGRTERRRADLYIESFFDIIASEQDRQDNIVNACLPWPPAP